MSENENELADFQGSAAPAYLDISPSAGKGKGGNLFQETPVSGFTQSAAGMPGAGGASSAYAWTGDGSASSKLPSSPDLQLGEKKWEHKRAVLAFCIVLAVVAVAAVIIFPVLFARSSKSSSSSSPNLNSNANASASGVTTTTTTAGVITTTGTTTTTTTVITTTTTTTTTTGPTTTTICTPATQLSSPRWKVAQYYQPTINSVPRLVGTGIGLNYNYSTGAPTDIAYIQGTLETCKATCLSFNGTCLGFSWLNGSNPCSPSNNCFLKQQMPFTFNTTMSAAIFGGLVFVTYFPPTVTSFPPGFGGEVALET